MKSLAVIGAPSSAGAYAPGQEQAPAVLRSVGLLEHIKNQGIQVADTGDVPGFRWQPDPNHPRAMNAEAVAKVARATADKVADALAEKHNVLVLGGDCTVELGTVAGALRGNDNIGLIYIDLDVDLNTPQSTDEGAFDWMGVAHLLNIQGAASELTSLGPRSPMLRPEQIYLFAYDNVTPFEQHIIDARSIAGTSLEEVAKSPQDTARAANHWAKQFDQLFIHLDVDVLNFVAFPLAENTRHHYGLNFEQLIVALSTLLSSPNWTGLTIAEVNPDHSNDVTLETFVEALAHVLAEPLK